MLVALLVATALVAGGVLVVETRPWRALGWGAAPTTPVMGAIPSWDQQDALTALREHPGPVTVASPWSYEVGADGVPVLQPGLTAASEHALNEQLRSLGLQVVPTVASTTRGLWDERTIAAVMANPARRRAHVAAVVALVEQGSYDGVQVDYENLAPQDRDALTATVRDLAAALHARGRALWVTVHAKESAAGYDRRNLAQDYRELGGAADHLVLMVYDWHWETGPPGPIGPVDWADRVVRYATSQVPAAKLILGVGLFGYDWGGDRTEVLTWRQTVAQAARFRADELWDLSSQSPHLTYTTAGATHQVWFENARSVREKLRLATEHELGGVALWRLGREDPAIWDLPAGVWSAGRDVTR